MKNNLIAVIIFGLSFCFVVPQNPLDKLKDFANTAKAAEPLVKDFFKDNKSIENLGQDLRSQLSNLLNGGSSSNSIDNDFIKMQFMMMMLKALQSSVLEGKNQSKAGFLNAESLGALLQMIQQYKSLFSQETTKESSREQTNSTQNELIKNLLADMAKKSLEDWSSESNESSESESAINEAFMKNLLNQMMSSGNSEAPNTPPSYSEENQGFSLKDLNQLMDSMKEINTTVNRQQLKEIADSFKEYFSETYEAEEDFGEQKQLERREEGANIGFIVIVTILSVILIVVILMLFRRHYKKRQYLAARMIEHKPLRSMDSEKNQI